MHRKGECFFSALSLNVSSFIFLSSQGKEGFQPLWHMPALGQLAQEHPQELLWFLLSRTIFAAAAATIASTASPATSEAQFALSQFSTIQQLLS